MSLPWIMIDAFVDGPFSGNPAAVCILEEELVAGTMAAVAGEFALSETAFVKREGDAWRLRWFSPAMEIPLCGHGSLATARALRELGLETGEAARFLTLAGEVTASYEEEWIELDFPARPAKEAPLPAEVAAALGLSAQPRWAGVNAGRNWLVDLGSAEAVRDLAPDREAVMALGSSLHGIIVTGKGDAREGAAGEEAAISSRFFAPEAGVFEDPVTGSAHCALAPYWAPRLGRDRFLAHQASRRGGLLRVTLDGARVRLAGRSAVVASGTIAAGIVAGRGS